MIKVKLGFRQNALGKRTYLIESLTGALTIGSCVERNKYWNPGEWMPFEDAQRLLECGNTYHVTCTPIKE